MSEALPSERKFVLTAMLAAALLSAVPYLIGVLTAPRGTQFLGFPYATDDHMVYAAWMRQAQEGRFFFDNRFAVDAQPGATIHIYFWVLGLLSKVTGLALASILGKSAATAWFVFLAHKLLRRISSDPFVVRVTLALVAFGGGLGFLVWQKFGETLGAGVPGFVQGALLGRLPTDVWQPEGFVYASAWTNGLFMIALCLILGTVWALLESEKSWKPAVFGALCLLALTNIHTYDTLLLGLVAVPFLAALAVSGKLTWGWVARGALIFAGAVPSALWVAHVLQIDPVFQARAATPTFAPNFRAVVMGYLPLIGLGMAALWPSGEWATPRRKAGWFLTLALLLTGWALAGSRTEGFFLSAPEFAIVFSLACAAAAMLARDDATWNWFACWAVAGLFAIYFPALFQRKLTMGLSVPWAVLGGWWLANRLTGIDLSKRRLTAIGAVGACSVSALFWLQREFYFIHHNVSRTTVHAIYLDKEVQSIVELLNARASERRTLLVIPGVANAASGDHGETEPDAFATPIISDLNAILAGLTGSYAYAGHWSETPQYLVRRDQSLKFFLSRTKPEQRADILRESGANYAVGPSPKSFGENGKSGFVDLATLGDVLYSGYEFTLVKLR